MTAVADLRPLVNIVSTGNFSAFAAIDPTWRVLPICTVKRSLDRARKHRKFKYCLASRLACVANLSHRYRQFVFVSRMSVNVKCWIGCFRPSLKVAGPE